MSETEISQLISQIDNTLNDIRPHLKVDGGDIEVVGITDDLVVEIKWLGNCVNCTMSTITMRAGVEQTIRSKHPEITNVIAINGMDVS